MKKALLIAIAALAMSLSSMAQAATHSVQLACSDTDILVSQFHFYSSAVSGGPYVQLDTTKVTACSFLDTGLAAGTTKFYVARAANVTGDLSGASLEVKAVVPPPPAAPTGLTATVVP